nr:ChaN family lipoprotein [Hongsoonwoonella zoysiae]
MSRHYGDHPLVGKIWSFEKKGFVAPQALIADAVGRRYVLLGEIHDNPDHHALQAWVVRSIAESGRKPAVVFEMIPQELQGDIDAYLALANSGAEGFGAAVRWEERGWPSWDVYQPIMDAAFDFSLVVRAGDADTRLRMKVGREGLNALGESEQKRLGLEKEESDIEREFLSTILYESHCGLVPRESLQPMANVQSFRDAALADAMLGSQGEGAVLIAGGGHVRDDLAAPKFLRRRGVAEDDILTIAIREVDPATDDAKSYLPQGVNEAKAFDYLWFTPVYDRTDHCAELKKRLGEKSN